jgi:vitamin K-dependent gamma-carboxylase
VKREYTKSSSANQPPPGARAVQRTLAERLASPVDGASIAVFRFAFGLLIAWEVVRYFGSDWIARYYVEPRFHFTYYGFGWVHPWPAIGMYLHFALLGAVALLVAFGLWYRVAAVLLWLAFTYVFLLDEARYLNHFYAASLFAFLLAVVPAEKAFSVDAWRRKPSVPPTVPTWALWLLRAQVGVIYFFGGVAKLNPDWIHGEPMRTWLIERSDVPLIDLIVRSRFELVLFSYGGLFFDLLVVPALLWRRTRPFAFAAAIVFHIMNSQLFAIGIFPWLMLAGTTLFFDASWPRRLMAWVRKRPVRVPEPVNAGRAVGLPVRVFLTVYLALQLAIPLRHFLYPGDVSWTEEGHRFSWRMKLRDKSGSAQFLVTDRSNGGTTTVVAPESVLSDWQVPKMVMRPDMILQFAHYLAREHGAPGRLIEVRVQSVVSLNGHESRPLVDPRVDLAAERRTLWPAAWVTRGRDVPDDMTAGNARN